MALDDLWDLHQTIIAVLESKLETQITELENRLRQLRSDIAPENVKSSHRPNQIVPPKFRNPTEPRQNLERARQATSLTELLNAGLFLEEF